MTCVLRFMQTPLYSGLYQIPQNLKAPMYP